MSLLFQVHEDDLADLERIIPQLSSAMLPHLDPKLKTQLRRIQKILSDVRWNYGPPSHVEIASDELTNDDDCQRS